jgi:hypothetical protein
MVEVGKKGKREGKGKKLLCYQVCDFFNAKKNTRHKGAKKNELF